MNSVVAESSVVTKSILPALLLVVVALIVHQRFRKRETYSVLAHAVLLVCPPALVSFVVGSQLHASGNPSHSFFFFASYILSLLCSIVIYRLSPFHPLAKYPGPTCARVSKLWMACMSARGYEHHYLRSLHDQYGDVVRVGPNELSIRNPAAIIPLMGVSGAPKGPNVAGGMLRMDDLPMIGMMDAKAHLQRRRAWNRALSPAAHKDYQPLIAARINQLLERFDENLGKEMLLGKWFNYMTHDFMCDMAFGGGSELLRDGDRDNVWSVIEHGMVFATFFSHVPWLGVYVGLIPYAGQPLTALVNYAQSLATKRVQRGSKSPDLFHYLNNEDVPDKAAPPKQQVIDDGILAVIAGADTTASVMTTIFFCVLSNPSVYKKLQEEVDRFFPKGEDPMQTQYHRDMHYLTAVINECLRMFPPLLSGGQRQIPFDGPTKTVDDITLPPGTKFWMPIYSLQRDARNFVVPDTYWPERWLIAGGRATLAEYPIPASTPFSHADFIHNEAAFIPFSYGPMNCVGMGLAMLEMRMLVCVVLQRFSLRLREGYDIAEYEREFRDYFVAARPPLPVILSQR